jgi:hypothetical protein
MVKLVRLQLAGSRHPHHIIRDVRDIVVAAHDPAESDGVAS